MDKIHGYLWIWTQSKTKAIHKSRFRHAHAHAGTAGWRHRHSKFILCLRHLLIEMPNHSLLICLNQSDLILEVSELHWCKTWFFVWHKLGHTDVEKTMAVIGTPLSTWQFCLLLSDGATQSFSIQSCSDPGMEFLFIGDFRPVNQIARWHHNQGNENQFTKSFTNL